MASRVVIHERNIRRHARSPAAVRAALALADRVKDAAEPATPVDTGRMRASWRTAAGVQHGRAVGRVYNIARDPKTGAPYPAFVEYGTDRMRAQRVLGRALDAVRATTR